MSPDDPGATVVETTIAVALVGVLAAMVAPELATWRARQSVAAAGSELAVELEAARYAALALRRTHAIVFRELQGAIRRGRAVDGDGDGVRSADLRDGVDTWLAHPAAGAAIGRGIAIGLPSSVPPLPGGVRPRDALPMPPSGILSVTPDGTLSTGTIYLCHEAGECFAVRSFGPGGRVSAWQFRGGRWVRRW